MVRCIMRRPMFHKRWHYSKLLHTQVLVKFRTQEDYQTMNILLHMLDILTLFCLFAKNMWSLRICLKYLDISLEAAPEGRATLPASAGCMR